MNHSQEVRAQFAARFDEPAAFVVRAPGRVNLIGEHTDYNDGFVLPMAIDRAVWIACAPRPDQQIRVYFIDFDAEVTFNLDGFVRGDDAPVEYVKGVTWALQEAGFPLRGWDGVIRGDVPIGAGLSSSAALEMAVARVFSQVAGFEWSASTMARLGQRAENGWVGVNSGIMDQMISASGRAGKALLIDCRDLSTELLPLPTGVRVVVLDTGTRRGLVASAYNERRSQCEAVADFFGVTALRDVTAEQLMARAGELEPLSLRRARHVVTENERVMQARSAMLADDARLLGLLMNASHDSLRDDFEVSSPALNSMVDLMRVETGCLGARMTGAGFGGCAVALVDENEVEAASARVAERYREQTGHEPALYICQPTDGAGLVD